MKRGFQFWLSGCVIDSKVEGALRPQAKAYGSTRAYQAAVFQGWQLSRWVFGIRQVRLEFRAVLQR